MIFSGELSPGRVFSCFWQSLHVYTVSNRLIQYSEYSMTASCKKVQTCYDATSNLQECMVQVWLCAILYCTTLRSYKIIRPFGIWAATASATASATATATENETESWNWKLKKTESSTWIFNLNIQLESSTWIFNLNLHRIFSESRDWWRRRTNLLSNLRKYDYDSYGHTDKT